MFSTHHMLKFSVWILNKMLTSDLSSLYVGFVLKVNEFLKTTLVLLKA